MILLRLTLAELRALYYYLREGGVIGDEQERLVESAVSKLRAALAVVER